jgi:4-aminobutyrate aminotransferase-like enzyme
VEGLERVSTDDVSALDATLRWEAPSMAGPVEEIGVAWERARGARVWDERGREYLDMTAGSGVHNVGHNHPEVVAAAAAQMGRLTHTGWQFPSPSRARLLERLAARMPFDRPRFVFAVTGSEAVEAALKLARAATGRPSVLSFLGGFHGKTGGALAVTARPFLRRGVSSHPPDVLRLPFPDATRVGPEDALRQLALVEEILAHPDFPIDEVAGIIVEPIQGASGMVAPPPGFLAALRDLTRRRGLLLIVDEIFTGMGRTGRFFGFEADGVVPDVVVMGKALGGGFPIALVAAPAELAARLAPYKQTSTFSGHPVACAAGLAVLDVLEREDLAANAARRGAELRLAVERMEPPEGRLRVTGHGLMLGIRVESEQPGAAAPLARRLNRELRRAGVLTLAGGTGDDVLKLTPPLVLSGADVDLFCSRLEAALLAAGDG